MDGDEDQGRIFKVIHAAGVVDPEGDEDVRVVPASGQAVSGGEEGLNSCLGRILPRQEEEENEEDEESNNNELSMPKRKIKDPAPVWKQCAIRLADGKGK